MKFILKKFDTTIAQIELTRNGFSKIEDYGSNIDDIDTFLQKRRYSGNRRNEIKARSLESEVMLTRLANNEDGYWLSYDNDYITSWSDLLHHSGSLQTSGRTSIATSPSGMQPKRFENGRMYKQDLFEGEAIGEVLSSLFLEACDEKNHIPYRFGDTTSTCVSYSWKPLQFIPMYDLMGNYIRENHPDIINKIDKHYPKQSDEFKEEKYIDLYMDRIYNKLPLRDKPTVFEAIAERYGVTNYGEHLRKMVTLDYIICNVDRHLNNFGLMTNGEVYEPAPIFDNGRSFGVSLEKGFDFNKAPALPFGSTQKRNLQAVDSYEFQLDPQKLISLCDKHIPDTVCKTYTYQMFEKRMREQYPETIPLFDELHGERLKLQIAELQKELDAMNRGL